MKRIVYLWLALLLPGLLDAASALDNARRAQALLGPATWSRVIRVENSAVGRRYPAVVYALVFEEAGILWFYADTDGTQSFTLHPDRLTEEKSDLAPLLRAIEPGFMAYEIQSEPGAGSPAAADGALPNGCFVESLAALSDRVRRGELIERARLLNCYVDTPAGRWGHTVLTYETRRGLFLLDPGRSPEPRRMPPAWADNPLALATAALLGANVARARWVPTTVPLAPTALVSLELTNDPGPGAATRLMR